MPTPEPLTDEQRLNRLRRYVDQWQRDGQPTLLCAVDLLDMILQRLDALMARNAALAAERNALHATLDKADILYGTFSITVEGTKLVSPDGTTHSFEGKVIVSQRQWMELQHALAVLFGMSAASQPEEATPAADALPAGTPRSAPADSAPRPPS